MKTKYDIEIPEAVLTADVKRLTNQLWKLIPMRENKENWKKQLDTVILEIVGLEELFSNPKFLQLICKLEGLKKQETDFELYRKTVFEMIGLLQEGYHDIWV